MPRVLITTPTFGRFSAQPQEILDAAAEVVRPQPSRALTREELLEHAPHAEALIVGMDSIDAEVLDAAPRLRVVAKHGVGVDTIDVAAARERGVRVVCAPGSNSRAVAELAFGLMLAAARGIGHSHADVVGGGWPKLFGPELAGRTLGVLGFGRIGRILGDYARAFGMTVRAYDPYLPAEVFAEHGAEAVDFAGCVAGSDFLSLHLPGDPAAPPLLDRAALESMRRGAILVNTARGGLVDEAALAELLHSGHLGGAGVDAFSVEPPAGNPLLSAPNAVLTSHLGACSHEANQQMGRMVAEDVVRVLTGSEPANEAP
ncbi:phosphoglycerate dehydrogenase [Saccharopolyspora sp. NFXS83]|uniref:phosphoglycerate dehydrogenase n=1 Tax=Saccharopolyspora sp. NFXS83 TaxID=2993560 RepID=UPI00224A7E6E|nr:phosphoglycerate dehydrogenase [Saccharopolyspora sp. NFXS83]MCX2730133.1 phosphoglycerate dehydrogenase [Saccharopolyspora sp. NFXS83]